MLVEIIKQVKILRDKEPCEKTKAGIQKSLILILEIDRENGIKQLQEIENLKKT